MPRYSIITPTVLRPQLLKLVESINAQTCNDWEHLIAVDGVVMNSKREEYSKRGVQ